MYLPIIFHREVTSYLSSRRFLFSLLLIFLPAVIGIWFSYMMYHNPSIIVKMTGGWITQVTPKICMMVYLDVAPLPIALTAIINASDFIAGEKKRGMLQLLASKPLERWEIVIGKYLSFLLVFLVLILLKLTIFNVALKFLGIGLIETKIFFSYVIVLVLTGIVYTSISTLFSSLMDNTLAVILAGFLLLIAWYIFDWMILYLPFSASHILEKFSLSYYIDNIIGYISRGQAVLFLRGGISFKVSLNLFLKSIAVVLGILTLLPTAVSIIILQKKDIV